MSKHHRASRPQHPVHSNKLIVTWLGSAFNRPHGSSRETFNNLKTRENALATLARLNKDNISHAIYNGEVLYSSKQAA